MKDSNEKRYPNKQPQMETYCISEIWYIWKGQMSITNPPQQKKETKQNVARELTNQQQARKQNLLIKKGVPSSKVIEWEIFIW